MMEVGANSSMGGGGEGYTISRLVHAFHGSEDGGSWGGGRLVCCLLRFALSSSRAHSITLSSSWWIVNRLLVQWMFEWNVRLVSWIICSLSKVRQSLSLNIKAKFPKIDVCWCACEVLKMTQETSGLLTLNTANSRSTWDQQSRHFVYFQLLSHFMCSAWWFI